MGGLWVGSAYCVKRCGGACHSVVIVVGIILDVLFRLSDPVSDERVPCTGKVAISGKIVRTPSEIIENIGALAVLWLLSCYSRSVADFSPLLL